MRKLLIFIVLGLSSLAALASVQPASAGKICHRELQQCDDNGKNCKWSQLVCKPVASPVGNSGSGATTAASRNRHQN